MPDSFIDQIINLADHNDWCMKYGCTTCGAFRFRSEIELAAANKIISKSKSTDRDKSNDFYFNLENLISEISTNNKPISAVKKGDRLFMHLFRFLQNEIINDLKISQVTNEEAIRIVLNDFDLENNAFEFEGTLVGVLIKDFMRQVEETNNKLISKLIKIIVINVKEQKLTNKLIGGPIHGLVAPVEIAIGEADRETEIQKVVINGKELEIISGCGSRDLTGHFWQLKSTKDLTFGNSAVLCKDDTSISYGPFYGQDCPLELDELIEMLVWGRMNIDSTEIEWTRGATAKDIIR